MSSRRIGASTGRPASGARGSTVRAVAGRLAALSCLLVLTACAGGPDIAPEELAGLDDEPAGLYRGVVAVEEVSGSYVLTIRGSGAVHDEPVFSIELSENGRTARDQVQGWSRGQGPKTVAYEGRVGGEDGFDVAVAVRLDEEGRVLETQFAVDGEPAIALTVKELSTRAVLTFEGTYDGTNRGIWNMIIAGDQAFAVYASHHNEDRGILTGDRTEQRLTLSGPGGLIEAQGVLDAARRVRGRWSERLGEPGEGSFEGTR